MKLVGGLAAAAVGGAGVVSAHELASVTFDDQMARGASVRVASATLPDGGWVVLHDPGQNFDVVGHSGGLDPGTHENVTVAIKRGKVDRDRRKMDRTLVAMAHRDTGVEGEYEFPEADPPYFDHDGNPIVDTAMVTF